VKTLFSQTDFAKLCGISKQAVNKSIHADPATILLNSQNKIDINLATNKAYLENAEARRRNSQAQTEATPADQQPTPGDYKTLDELKRKTELQRGIKLQIENQRKRNELVPIEDTKRVFSEMYTIHQTGFLNMGRSLTPLIMAICEVTAPGKEVEISEAVTTAVYQHLARIKLEINNFLKEYPLEDQT